MRTPVTILSGFLGSGKTTRLNALLHAPHGRRLAVVLNEVGAVGIDSARLAGAEEFVELEGGCLCCVLNPDFERTLARLAARGGIDHVVVETTGIADPLAAAWTIDRPAIREQFRLDAIVTVVDALNLNDALDTHPEAGLQIERADLVLLSKLDLATCSEASVRTRIRELNPVARIVASPRGEVDAELLLDLPGAPATIDYRRAAPPTTHTAWETWEWTTPAILSAAAVEDFLRDLPPDVYRAKGLVQTEELPPWLQVHAVAGRYEIEPCRPDPAPTASRLLAIGHGLDRRALDAAAAKLAAARANQGNVQ